MQNIIPFSVGGQSTSADYAALLGQKFQVGDTWYRLVKASATLAANQVVTTAFTAGVPTWNVGTTTAANDPAVVGFVPAAYTTAPASGAYFLMQITGNVTPLLGNTTQTVTTITNTLGTATTAGCVQSLGSISTGLDYGAACGLLTGTAVVTAIGQVGIGVITGLLAKG